MAAETKVLYEFGRFCCDPGEHLLLCDGKPVSLSPKSFEILVALIRSNSRLLTKDELMQQVWPDSFVEEANLTVNISALRKVLGGPSGAQQYIETVPKLGYRFVAPVTEHRDVGKPDPPLQSSHVKQSERLFRVATVPAWLARSGGWWLAAGLLLVAVLASVLVPVVQPSSPMQTLSCWPILPIRRVIRSSTTHYARDFPRNWSSRRS